LAYVKYRGNISFSSGEGIFGFGVMPGYAIICYEESIREACESVVKEMNDVAVKSVLESHGRDEDSTLAGLLTMIAGRGGGSTVPGVKVYLSEEAIERDLI